MSRHLVWVSLLCFVPSFVLAQGGQTSVVTNLETACIVTAPGPKQIKTCKGPAGYEAVIHQTPMGEQLTLENASIAFSAAVIRCARGQVITSLGWRIRAEKPFAAFIGYKCIGTKAQSAGGGQNKILVQGLKGFEEYGHEVRAKNSRPTMAAAEKLADGWLAPK